MPANAASSLLVALAIVQDPPPVERPDDPPAPPPMDRPIFDVAPVVVTPTRGEEPLLEVPQAITVVDAAKMRRLAPQNTPDALSEEPGLVMQRSNQGGGSPVLRGRSGKDVLLLIDGQRFTNSTFRRNHQYLNTVDAFAVESIEVLRGPASVLYGSDAMGGAVNLLLRRPELAGVDHFGGRAHFQYDTVNDGLVSHLDAEAEVEGFGVLAGYTWRHFDDLAPGRVGSNPIYPEDVDGKQVPTGYREQAANVALSHRLGEKDVVDLAFLYSRQWNVPTSERVIPNEKEPNPSDLSRESDPQRLRWWELRWLHSDEGALVESAQATASLNAPVEGRRRVRAATPQLLTVERDELTAPGLALQTGLRVTDDHLLTVGAEGYFESIDSQSSTFDSTTGTWTKNPTGRYPDGADYDTLGVFVQDEWRFGDGWEWINGVRYSRIAVDLDFEGLVVGSAGPFGELDHAWDDVTFATGLSRRLSETTSVYGSISRGFRAPNLDDLAVVGDFAAGNRIPNFDVEPEKVWNFEVGAHHVGPRTSGGAALASALYEDLLTNQLAFTLGGVDYFVVDNADRATIWSGELWLDQELCRDDLGIRHSAIFQAFASFGRNHSANEPVSKVPPPEGLLGWRMEGGGESEVGRGVGDGVGNSGENAAGNGVGSGVGSGAGTGARDVAGESSSGLGSFLGARRWYFETFARGALAQRRLAEVDKADPRFPNSGTPAWWTLNFRGGVNVARGAWLVLGLENVFNYRYRVHGSGIDAPGRNFTIGVDWVF